MIQFETLRTEKKKMPETSRPNILFIMADDHATKAISCYNGNINKTPNIDRIADEGIRFDNCYVTNSICTPSRAAILTGTYNHVNCVTTLNTYMDNRMPNLAKHLKTGGYQTAIVGKWHLGEGKKHEPTGFDYWSVLPGQGDYFDPFFIEKGNKNEVSGYVTNIITEKIGKDSFELAEQYFSGTLSVNDEELNDNTIVYPIPVDNLLHIKNLNKNRREALFIQLLEDLHPADAKILAENMISHTPIKGITKKTLEAAFPTLFTDPLNFK